MGGVAVVVQRQRGQIVEIVEVLESHRLVSTQVSVDNGDTLFVGSLTKHHARGISGKDVEEEKHQRDHAKKDEESVEEPFKGVVEHVIRDVSFFGLLVDTGVFSFAIAIP